MNRRHFLATSAAAATLTAAETVSAQATGRLKVLIPTTPPDQLADLKAAAPGIELVACSDNAAALENVAGAHASYGFISRPLIRAGKDLRWVQQASAGVEQLMEIPELVESNIVLTNMQRVYGPPIADQALGYLLAFTRSLAHFVQVQPNQEWRSRQPGVVLDELMGKTLVLIGLGGIGSEIARRAHAFGMRVLATDPKVWDKPPSVAELQEGLDVTDPEPLPKGHALWSQNVIITPHTAGQSPGSDRRRHEVFRENLGRFARGEMLVNVVDKKVGY